MNEVVTSSIFIDSQQPDANLQDALETGGRAYEMLFKLLDVLKIEMQHTGAGESMSPREFLYKIIGMAHEYNLPELREKALAYQELGQ